LLEELEVDESVSDSILTRLEYVIFQGHGPDIGPIATAAPP
jgi:hypothetical protein